MTWEWPPPPAGPPRTSAPVCGKTGTVIRLVSQSHTFILVECGLCYASVPKGKDTTLQDHAARVYVYVFLSQTNLGCELCLPGEGRGEEEEPAGGHDTVLLP